MNFEDLKPIVEGLDPSKPLVMAGPCSAETEEQTLSTARQLAMGGIKIFRAGIWKPRTKPGGFEGIGKEGLAWLQRVREETGMLVATEVAMRAHVLDALRQVWIFCGWVRALPPTRLPCRRLPTLSRRQVQPTWLCW